MECYFRNNLRHSLCSILILSRSWVASCLFYKYSTSLPASVNHSFSDVQPPRARSSITHFRSAYKEVRQSNKIAIIQLCHIASCENSALGRPVAYLLRLKWMDVFICPVKSTNPMSTLGSPCSSCQPFNFTMLTLVFLFLQSSTEKHSNVEQRWKASTPPDSGVSNRELEASYLHLKRCERNYDLRYYLMFRQFASSIVNY